MNKIMEKLQQNLVPIAKKIAANKYLSSLSETMMIVLPLIMVGSFACLFANVNIPFYQEFLNQHTGLLNAFASAQCFTVNLIAVYVLIVLAYKVSKKLDIEALTTMIATLAIFLMLTPSELNVSLSQEWLGYKGMITGIILGMIIPRTIKLIKDKKLVIKMPESVPEFVSDSFSSLIPILIVVVIAQIINFIAIASGQGSVHQIIYTVLQIPFQHLSSSLPGIIIIMFACTLFMSLGVHANTILYVVFPMYVANGAANLAAYQAKEALPNIVTSSWFIHIVIGGVGCVLPLIVLLAFFAKSERLKSVGKIALIPNIFNISEPVLFGAPILFNPILMIPYIFTSVFNVIVGYVAIAIQLVPRMTGVEVVWSMPVVLSGFLSQGWQFALLQVILFFADLAIWYPFVKTYDNIVLQEEKMLEVKE